MFSSNVVRPLAAYGVSHPMFAAPPALAKETVYMPSELAALVLGRGPVTGAVIRSSSEASGSRPDASAA